MAESVGLKGKPLVIWVHPADAENVILLLLGGHLALGARRLCSTG